MDDIRVKIRKHGNPSAKLLRFEKSSMQLNPLIMKIAWKLKGIEDMAGFDASQHQLLLDGKYLVERVSEIENDDELVLQRTDEAILESSTTSPQRVGSVISTATATTSVTPVKKEDESTHQISIKKEPDESTVEVITMLDNDESTARPDSNASQSNLAVDSGGPRVAGVKREAHPIRQEKMKKKKPEIITIDDDSDTDDDSSSDGSIEDGSDAWMSSDEDDNDGDEDSDESDFEPDSDDDSEDEIEVKKPTTKASHRTKESPLQVLMDEKDIPSAPGKREGNNKEEEQEEEVSLLVNGAGRQKTDKAVKDRIIKLLNTGFHDQSNEHEAKNAMKLAQRLMRKHNLSQALLLKERDEKNSGNKTNNNGVLRGGMVHVEIINRKTQKPALLARWLTTLAYHVGKNFDVKYYYTARRGRKCRVTFYGIYTNAQLAGYAFRVATERISQMGSTYEPKKRSNISLASCRLSYCIGVVQGIGDEVERNIHEEKLKRLRKLERARLAVSQGEAYEESDNEGSDEHDNDGGAGYSFPDPVSKGGNGGEDRKPSATNLPMNGSTEQNEKGGSEQGAPLDLNSGESAAKPSILSGKALDQRLQELENENQAALVLVDHGKKVAEKVLKENGVKLRSGRRRSKMNFDDKSYRQGIEDSKEVDINQRAIRDEVKVKREVKSE